MMKYIAFIINLPFSIVGIVIALISVPKKVRFDANNMAFIFSINSLWWTSVVPWLKGARATVTGHTVLLGPDADNADLDHELIHVDQWIRAPFIHPFLYYIEYFKHGYRQNKYEDEAYRASGSRYEIKKNRDYATEAIRVVLFDVDGVLVNTEMFSRQYERDFGIPHQKLDPFFTGVFRQCLTGDADLKEVLKPYLPGWGWKGNVDGLLDYWFKAENNPNELLIKYIRHLRSHGVRCHVATNQEKYRVNYLLEVMGFAADFDGIFASSSLGSIKPSPEFFRLVIERLDLYKLSQVLFWDDEEKCIQSAREFGLKAEVYDTFDHFKKIMHKYKLDHIE